MSTDLLMSIAGALGVAFVLSRMYGWIGATADLRLALFRPYHGDPWPRGVQEDDEVHWQWTKPVAVTGSAVDDDAPLDGPTVVDDGVASVACVPVSDVGRIVRR